MAITTYAELQTAIARWLDREDDAVIEDRIPEWIALAEARLNRVGLLRSMETETDLTTTASLDYVALPTGFLNDIAAWIEIDSVRTPLTKAQPQEFEGSATNSIPRMYAIDGLYVKFDCPAADAYTVPFRYMKSFALSESTTTNYLLEKAPDVYLFASLAEAAPFLMDDTRIAVWESKAQRAITEQNRIENKSRHAPLRGDFALSRPRSNIFTG